VLVRPTVRRPCRGIETTVPIRVIRVYSWLNGFVTLKMEYYELVNRYAQKLQDIRGIGITIGLVVIVLVLAWHKFFS